MKKFIRHTLLLTLLVLVIGGIFFTLFFYPEHVALAFIQIFTMWIGWNYKSIYKYLFE